MRLLGLLEHVRRNLDNVELCAQSLVAPFDRAKTDEIDDPDEVALDADRQLSIHYMGIDDIAAWRKDENGV